MSQLAQDRPEGHEVGLRRSVGVFGLVLYGLGVTIGAGIYVLVGETVVIAGQYAPAAFLLSAIVMGFTAGSFAELSSRVPKAAGEAVYVEEAFHLPWLTILVGLVVLIDAMIAAAAISVGAAGYVAELVGLSRPMLIAGIVLIVAARVAYGMANAGRLPKWIGQVSPATPTPLRATALVTAIVLGLALFTPLGLLAETTSAFLLSVFSVVR